MAKIQVITKGRTAELIDEGAIIRDRIKADELRLDEIKATLSSDKHNVDAAGMYIGNERSLEIQERKNKAVIEPAALLQELKNERKGKHFPECVNVIVGRVSNFLNKETVNKLKKSSGSYFTWSFK